jgi:hypothetical protein
MGVLLICAGMFVIWARQGCSDAMNSMPWMRAFSKATPRVAVLMGIAWIFIGALLLFGF